MAEAARYPFLAMQWHPEKASFEWGSPKIPHSLPAVQLAQAVSLAFVEVRIRGLFLAWSQELLATMHDCPARAATSRVMWLMCTRVNQASNVMLVSTTFAMTAAVAGT
jgi:hypothetical protein